MTLVSDLRLRSWRTLRSHNPPIFLFVKVMDQIWNCNEQCNAKRVLQIISKTPLTTNEDYFDRTLRFILFQTISEVHCLQTVPHSPLGLQNPSPAPVEKYKLPCIFIYSHSALMPTARHFWSRQYWHRFLWGLLTGQSLFPRHAYPSCFLMLLLKNPLHPSQLVQP